MHILHTAFIIQRWNPGYHGATCSGAKCTSLCWLPRCDWNVHGTNNCKYSDDERSYKTIRSGHLLCHSGWLHWLDIWCSILLICWAEQIKEEIGGAWGLHVSNYKCTQDFSWETWINRPLGRSEGRWEDNTKVNLKEMLWETMDWIHMTERREKWCACVNREINHSWFA
jgi:hypothetical protein